MKVFFYNGNVINCEDNDPQAARLQSLGAHRITPSIFGGMEQYANNDNTTVTGWVDEVKGVEYVAPVAETEETAAIEEVKQVKAIDGNTGVWSFDLEIVEVKAKNNKVDSERVWRDSELIAYVDHFQKVLVWGGLDLEQQNAISNYRNNLLEYPQSDGFPDTRPIRPSITI